MLPLQFAYYCVIVLYSIWKLSLLMCPITFFQFQTWKKLIIIVAYQAELQVNMNHLGVQVVAKLFHC